mgnify:CR=1 FL=1
MTSHLKRTFNYNLFIFYLFFFLSSIRHKILVTQINFENCTVKLIKIINTEAFFHAVNFCRQNIAIMWLLWSTLSITKATILKKNLHNVAIQIKSKVMVNLKLHVNFLKALSYKCLTLCTITCNEPNFSIKFFMNVDMQTLNACFHFPFL